jgi:DNA-binding LacI/PurR family transcriptional regulator
MTRARPTAVTGAKSAAGGEPADAPAETAPGGGPAETAPGGGPAGAPAEAAPGGQRRSRLIDIAEAVGVHVSTVSRVLNGDPAQSIRPEVYERILSTARQQGYRPNALARALKARRTGALALVVPLERNPSWARLQGGALQRARERGYVIMIMEEPTEEPKPPGDYRYLVEESRADGLLLATSLRVPEHGQGVSGAPHVYINRRGPDRGHDVVMDEPGAVRLFLDHAAGLGHRSFALIDGWPTADTVHRRAAAARRICAARGYDITVRHAAPNEDGGWEAATKMLRRGPLPTVCGVGHLTQLFGVMAALRTAGVEVPGQMSVVSFDEDQSLAYLEVAVTSVCMPLPELGEAAVDALIARVEGGPAGDVMVREPMTLRPRDSVAPPPVRPS